MDKLFEDNRTNWDERARIHTRDTTGFYDLEAFRSGNDVLGPVEAAEIGDVTGKRLLHLQCHFGLDTLSLARRGAHVTGLDFAPSAIAAARDLAEEVGLEAQFVEGNLYDAPDLVEGTFDIVYVSWGAICWLPDIRRWAEIVANFLNSDGVFYFAESHPMFNLLEEEDGDIVLRYGWLTPKDEPLSFDEAVTYTGDETPLTSTRTHEWHHPLSEIFGGLRDAGLQIEMFNEHTVLPWPQLPMMVETSQGLYRLPDGKPEIPLSFSLKARKFP